MKPTLQLKALSSLTAVLALTACGDRGASDQTAAEVIRPVIYHEVAAASGQSVRSFPARVSAADMRELTFPVGGVVLPVPVDESDAVTRGQLLAQLDARDYESALSAAQARADNAVQELDRARRLFAEDAIARSVLEQREAAANVAAADLEAAQKALADTRIEAPFDGVISRIFVDESQTVSPGTPAIRLFSRNDLEATIAVPASLIVNADGSRKEQGKALVRLDADPERPIQAAFKKAELEADTNSQSYAVTFGFRSPENLTILPGMNAEVGLTLRQRDALAGSVTVPLRAIGAQGDEQFVWVIERAAEPHRVSRRLVTVAPAVGEFLPITSGLEPGETIVAAGVSELVEGMAVRPWDRTGE
jgi:RND family efflux transporter MFP subunit